MHGQAEEGSGGGTSAPPGAPVAETGAEEVPREPPRPPDGPSLENLPLVPGPAWNPPVAPPEPVEPEPAGDAGPVSFSAEGGTYHPPLTLSLSSPGGGAEIRYTDDGSEPGPESALYTRGDPLFLGCSTTISARAFRQGREPGPVATHRYEMQAPQWRALEPEDRTDEVPHQRWDAEPGFAPGWSLAAASVRGRLHAHRGSWREDAYAYARRGDWLILAVSDGAGSAPLSRVGSQVACDRAVEEMRLRLDEGAPGVTEMDTLRESVLPKLRAQMANAGRAALNGIREAAAVRGGRPPEEFAPTLLLAVLCPWQGQHLVGCLQVGDGHVALLAEKDGPECRLLGEADHGAHSSETRFLTTRGVEESLEHRVRFTVSERLAALALMTDGVSDDFFPEEKRLAELFTGGPAMGMTGKDGRAAGGVLRGVTTSPDPGQALREWLEYEKKGSSDDRTLLLVWSRT